MSPAGQAACGPDRTRPYNPRLPDLAAERTIPMATHLDLEEQEQLDQLKHFWKQYGNLITWLLIAVLAAFAAWNGWNLWQRDQAVKAGAMYDEIDKSVQAGDADRAAALFGGL